MAGHFTFEDKGIDGVVGHLTLHDAAHGDALAAQWINGRMQAFFDRGRQVADLNQIDDRCTLAAARGGRCRRVIRRLLLGEHIRCTPVGRLGLQIGCGFS